jgi:hypothetical protein
MDGGLKGERKKMGIRIVVDGDEHNMSVAVMQEHQRKGVRISSHLLTPLSQRREIGSKMTLDH